jgi:Zn-dependent protease with chaperone function
VTRIEPTKIERTRTALRVPEKFEGECHKLLGETAKITGLQADTVLSAPPLALQRAVSNAVASFMKSNQPRSRRIEGLCPILFQHPADRSLLRAFESIPGAGAVVGKVIDVFVRSEELRLMSGAIKVTPSSCAPLWDCYREACTSLDIGEPPPLYIEQGGLNAYTTGTDHPYVVISSAAVSLLNRPETVFILGHELGHVLAGHVRYQTAARFLAQASLSAVPLLGTIAELAANVAIKPALFAWYRRAEYTGDRAGLLACQNREAAVRVMMKLAGYPPSLYQGMQSRQFLSQASDYESTLRGELIDRLMDVNQVVGETHPRLVLRATELLSWYQEGYYSEITAASPELLQTMA